MVEKKYFINYKELKEKNLCSGLELLIYQLKQTMMAVQ